MRAKRAWMARRAMMIMSSMLAKGVLRGKREIECVDLVYVGCT